MSDTTHIDPKELAELRRLAVLGRCLEQTRAEEAKAAEELAEKAKQIETEHRIAWQVVDQLKVFNAAKQADDDARVAEAVHKRLKAEEKRQADKGKQNLEKALTIALVGAVIGFYGSLVKTAFEDDEST